MTEGALTTAGTLTKGGTLTEDALTEERGVETPKPRAEKHSERESLAVGESMGTLDGGTSELVTRSHEERVAASAGILSRAREKPEE